MQHLLILLLHNISRVGPGLGGLVVAEAPEGEAGGGEEQEQVPHGEQGAGSTGP